MSPASARLSQRAALPPRSSTKWPGAVVSLRPRKTTLTLFTWDSVSLLALTLDLTLLSTREASRHHSGQISKAVSKGQMLSRAIPWGPPSPLQKGRAYPQSIWTVMIIGDTHLTLPRYQGLCQVQSRIQGVACLTERELAWRPLQVGGGGRNPIPGWSYSACALSSVS